MIRARSDWKITGVGSFSVFILDHLKSRLGATTLCKHDVFEIFFVLIKQTAACITTSILSVWDNSCIF